MGEIPSSGKHHPFCHILVRGGHLSNCVICCYDYHVQVICGTSEGCYLIYKDHWCQEGIMFIMAFISFMCPYFHSNSPLDWNIKVIYCSFTKKHGVFFGSCRNWTCAVICFIIFFYMSTSFAKKSKDKHFFVNANY